jgi:hypothetical protein
MILSVSRNGLARQAMVLGLAFQGHPVVPTINRTGHSPNAKSFTVVRRVTGISEAQVELSGVSDLFGVRVSCPWGMVYNERLQKSV